MKGSETGLLRFMGGYSDRYIIPVYQRRYNWRKEQCRQLYQDRECKIVCVNRYCMNLLYAPYWGKQR